MMEPHRSRTFARCELNELIRRVVILLAGWTPGVVDSRFIEPPWQNLCSHDSTRW